MEIIKWANGKGQTIQLTETEVKRLMDSLRFLLSGDIETLAVAPDLDIELSK